MHTVSAPSPTGIVKGHAPLIGWPKTSERLQGVSAKWFNGKHESAPWYGFDVSHTSSSLGAGFGIGLPSGS